jgi:hypothetical protein
LHNPAGVLNSFLQDLKANAASRSITVDILLFFLAAERQDDAPRH